jgi:hypothetical protein
MKKLFILLFVLPVACTTTQFSPYELGISDKAWQKLSPQKQQEIIQKNQNVITNMESQAPTGNSCLTITVADGKAKMPPFNMGRYAFQPAKFNISEGSCTSFDLTTKDKTNSSSPYACYRNNVLMLDPSKYAEDKMYGTVKIYKTPLWEEGFTYTNINTTGYAELRNATIIVKERQKTPAECMPKTAPGKK